MSELPKFYIDKDTPADSPFRQAANAWEDIESQYVRNRLGIAGIMNDATSELIQPANPGQTRKERASFAGIRIEENLSEEYPEFSIAVNQLKLAFDGIIHMRRPITWNHYVRGKAIGFDSIESGKIEGQDAAIFMVKRAMATFPEDSGYPIGHQIGFGTPAASALGGFAGYPFWVEVAPEQEANRGIMYSLPEMFAIREGRYKD